MADRTFKVFGSAYAASGNVSVTITIDGTQRFSGEVTTSATPRDGQPTSQSELISFTMDDSVTGDKSLSVAVSGGEFVMGNWQCNAAHYNSIVDIASLTDNGADIDTDASAQQTIASGIGQATLDAQKSGLYAKLNGGTATIADDADDINIANRNGLNTTDYVWLNQANDKKTSPQIDGTAVEGGMGDSDSNSAQWWPIISDGETFTATWSITPFDNWPDFAVS
jgi:hypothetical protein